MNPFHLPARSCRLLLALTLSVIATGCAEPLQPAGGKVLVDGVPVNVENGTITFHPTAGGRPASGRIMEDGTFTMSFMNEGDGLPVGDYKVVIVADIWKERATKTGERDAEILKKAGIDDPLSITVAGELIHVVPEVYNTVTTTPLTQTVTEADQPHQFEFDIPVKTAN
jgi:hypothetical protein